MNTRKSTVVLLTSILLLAALFLAACGGGEEETAPAEGAAAQPAASNEGDATSGALKFLYFTAADCAPCDRMNPIIEQMGKDNEGKIVVEKYDAASEEGKKLMGEHSLTKTPSYVILGSDGAMLWSNAGEIHKDMLKQQLIALLP